MFLALATALALAAPAPGPGPVQTYVELALAHSPRVAAADARAAAAADQIAVARTPPDPVVRVGGYVQSVETRVGPQQARLGVSQALPWPTGLLAAGRAAADQARAADHVADATRRGVAAEVRIAYWTLWEIRTTRALHEQHQALLDGLAEAVRARLEVGRATLAELQQVDLARARLDDDLASLDADEIGAEAALAALLGEAAPSVLTTDDEPAVAPVTDPESLREQADRHPALQARQARADAEGQRARAAGARRLPDLTVSGDWIVTAPPADPSIPDAGKDAVMVGVGVRVPLWQGAHGHQVASARSRAQAEEAAHREARDQLMAQLAQLRAEVDDTARRTQLIADTLLPQADAAYRSLLGEAAAGRAQGAQLLLAQRDLLDLDLQLARSRADHARAWARLAALTGGTP